MNKELYSKAYELINNLQCIRIDLTLWCEIECDLTGNTDSYEPTTYHVLWQEHNSYRVMEHWVWSILISKSDIDYITGHKIDLNDCHNAIAKFIHKYAWDPLKIDSRIEAIALNWDFWNSYLQSQSDKTWEVLISYLTP